MQLVHARDILLRWTTKRAACVLMCPSCSRARLVEQCLQYTERRSLGERTDNGQERFNGPAVNKKKSI